MNNRYDTSSHPEGQLQPDSDGLVLVNQLGITNVEEMEGEEYDALLELQNTLVNELFIDKQISVNDLSVWHKRWLGKIYSWAGEYRSVNMSKGDFVFAAAHLIPALMKAFEKQYLDPYTPCLNMSQEQLVEAMAICHVEFIIIHPFREGNGRLGRLLATIMALQADMPLLDFASIDQDKDHYISAIHAGHAGNYEPMKAIFSKVLESSISGDGT